MAGATLSNLSQYNFLSNYLKDNPSQESFREIALRQDPNVDSTPTQTSAGLGWYSNETLRLYQGITYTEDENGNLKKELPESETEGPILVEAGDRNVKRCNNPNNGNYYIEEIRPPYLRRTPKERPIIIEMIDSNNKEVMIELQDASLITALKLAPNPESLTINANKIVSKYNTMTRWVEEHWGDNPDMINMSGSTYSFCAMTQEGTYSGLTNARRDSSVAFKYLKSLVTFFRTNGNLYQESNVYALNNPIDVDGLDYDYSVTNKYLIDNYDSRNNHPRHGMLRERNYIRMKFDFVTFIGFFESFDITESSSSPFRLTYNLSFKSEKTIWNNNI